MVQKKGTSPSPKMSPFFIESGGFFMKIAVIFHKMVPSF